ncbi:hypothetical protein AB8Z38_28930 [Bradyrhizobium sp. LLZ17]|uniref:Uncharacterized protein n=1 Tax=Bradyrhizobium sp. LLZ17 TaxID=3239388 RepID=A0AB39XJV7_9BRAD
MTEEVVVVFTAKSIEQILAEGGTSSWRLDRNHARQCDYAVCTRNAHADWVEGAEPHHTAFMIGKVSGVAPSGDNGRFLVQFSEYAKISIPDAWKGGRNPVSYSSLADLGIDPTQLDWQPMPQGPSGSARLPAAPEGPAPSGGTSRGLTMAEAKAGLALTFGVRPEAIEITIRG